jgi:hypothetical protein
LLAVAFFKESTAPGACAAAFVALSAFFAESCEAGTTEGCALAVRGLIVVD